MDDLEPPFIVEEKTYVGCWETVAHNISNLQEAVEIAQSLFGFGPCDNHLYAFKKEQEVRIIDNNGVII